MKNAVLQELIDRWEWEARSAQTDAVDDSEQGRIDSEKIKAHRECKRECADALRTLMQLLPSE